jgi:hypothetical protein
MIDAIDAIVAMLAIILAQLGSLAALQGRRPRSQHLSLDPRSLTLQKVVRFGAASQRGLL